MELQEIVKEAQRLRAQNDGSHNMHGYCINLESWLRLAQQDGLKIVDWGNVDSSIKWMRKEAKQ